MKPVSNPFKRERLLKIAIGQTVSGKKEEIPWDIMPPTRRWKKTKNISYISNYHINKKSSSIDSNCNGERK